MLETNNVCENKDNVWGIKNVWENKNTKCFGKR